MDSNIEETISLINHTYSELDPKDIDGRRQTELLVHISRGIDKLSGLIEKSPPNSLDKYQYVFINSTLPKFLSTLCAQKNQGQSGDLARSNLNGIITLLSTLLEKRIDCHTLLAKLISFIQNRESIACLKGASTDQSRAGPEAPLMTEMLLARLISSGFTLNLFKLFVIGENQHQEGGLRSSKEERASVSLSKDTTTNSPGSEKTSQTEEVTSDVSFDEIANHGIDPSGTMYHVVARRPDSFEIQSPKSRTPSNQFQMSDAILSLSLEETVQQRSQVMLSMDKDEQRHKFVIGDLIKSFLSCESQFEPSHYRPFKGEVSERIWVPGFETLLSFLRYLLTIQQVYGKHLNPLAPFVRNTMIIFFSCFPVNLLQFQPSSEQWDIVKKLRRDMGNMLVGCGYSLRSKDDSPTLSASTNASRIASELTTMLIVRMITCGKGRVSDMGIKWLKDYIGRVERSAQIPQPTWQSDGQRLRIKEFFGLESLADYLSTQRLGAWFFQTQLSEPTIRSFRPILTYLASYDRLSVSTFTELWAYIINNLFLASFDRPKSREASGSQSVSSDEISSSEGNHTVPTSRSIPMMGRSGLFVTFLETGDPVPHPAHRPGCLMMRDIVEVQGFSPLSDVVSNSFHLLKGTVGIDEKFWVAIESLRKLGDQSIRSILLFVLGTPFPVTVDPAVLRSWGVVLNKKSGRMLVKFLAVLLHCSLTRLQKLPKFPKPSQNSSKLVVSSSNSLKLDELLLFFFHIVTNLVIGVAPGSYRPFPIGTQQPTSIFTIMPQRADIPYPSGETDAERAEALDFFTSIMEDPSVDNITIPKTIDTNIVRLVISSLISSLTFYENFYCELADTLKLSATQATDVEPLMRVIPPVKVVAFAEYFMKSDSFAPSANDVSQIVTKTLSLLSKIAAMRQQYVYNNGTDTNRAQRQLVGRFCSQINHKLFIDAINSHISPAVHPFFLSDTQLKAVVSAMVHNPKSKEQTGENTAIALLVHATAPTSAFIEAIPTQGSPALPSIVALLDEVLLAAHRRARDALHKTPLIAIETPGCTTLLPTLLDLTSTLLSKPTVGLDKDTAMRLQYIAVRHVDLVFENIKDSLTLCSRADPSMSVRRLVGDSSSDKRVRETVVGLVSDFLNVVAGRLTSLVSTLQLVERSGHGGGLSFVDMGEEELWRTEACAAFFEGLVKVIFVSGNVSPSAFVDFLGSAQRAEVSGAKAKVTLHRKKSERGDCPEGKSPKQGKLCFRLVDSEGRSIGDKAIQVQDNSTLASVLRSLAAETRVPVEGIQLMCESSLSTQGNGKRSPLAANSPKSGKYKSTQNIITKDTQPSSKYPSFPPEVFISRGVLDCPYNLVLSLDRSTIVAIRPGFSRSPKQSSSDSLTDELRSCRSTTFNELYHAVFFSTNMVPFLRREPQQTLLVLVATLKNILSTLGQHTGRETLETMRSIEQKLFSAFILLPHSQPTSQWLQLTSLEQKLCQSLTTRRGVESSISSCLLEIWYQSHEWLDCQDCVCTAFGALANVQQPADLTALSVVLKVALKPFNREVSKLIRHLLGPDQENTKKAIPGFPCLLAYDVAGFTGQNLLDSLRASEAMSALIRILTFTDTVEGPMQKLRMKIHNNALALILLLRMCGHPTVLISELNKAQMFTRDNTFVLRILHVLHPIYTAVSSLLRRPSTASSPPPLLPQPSSPPQLLIPETELRCLIREIKKGVNGGAAPENPNWVSAALEVISYLADLVSQPLVAPLARDLLSRARAQTAVKTLLLTLCTQIDNELGISLIDRQTDADSMCDRTTQHTLCESEFKELTDSISLGLRLVDELTEINSEEFNNGIIQHNTLTLRSTSCLAQMIASNTCPTERFQCFDIKEHHDNPKDMLSRAQACTLLRTFLRINPETSRIILGHLLDGSNSFPPAGPTQEVTNIPKLVGMDGNALSSHIDSVIQLLFHLPLFRQRLLRSSVLDELDTSQSVSQVLREMFLYLQGVCSASIDTTDFYKRLSSLITDVAPSVPQDATEVLLYILDALSDEGNGFVNDLFMFECCNETIGEGRCTHTHKIYNPKRISDLGVEGKSSLSASLTAETQGVSLRGAEAVVCSDCGGKRDSVVRKSFATLPNYLVFQLGRLALGPSTRDINTRFLFPESINMSAFMKNTKGDAHGLSSTKPSCTELSDATSMQSTSDIETMNSSADDEYNSNVGELLFSKGETPSVVRQPVIDNQGTDGLWEADPNYTVFDLRGVLVFLGPINSGNYVTLVKTELFSKTQGGGWVLCNGNKVSDITMQDVQTMSFGGGASQSSAHVLIYERRGPPIPWSHNKHESLGNNEEEASRFAAEFAADLLGSSNVEETQTIQTISQKAAALPLTSFVSESDIKMLAAENRRILGCNQLISDGVSDLLADMLLLPWNGVRSVEKILGPIELVKLLDKWMEAEKAKNSQIIADLTSSSLSSHPTLDTLDNDTGERHYKALFPFGNVCEAEVDYDAASLCDLALSVVPMLVSNPKGLKGNLLLIGAVLAIFCLAPRVERLRCGGTGIESGLSKSLRLLSESSEKSPLQPLVSVFQHSPKSSANSLPLLIALAHSCGNQTDALKFLEYFGFSAALNGQEPFKEHQTALIHRLISMDTFTCGTPPLVSKIQVLHRLASNAQTTPQGSAKVMPDVLNATFLLFDECVRAHNTTDSPDVLFPYESLSSLILANEPVDKLVVSLLNGALGEEGKTQTLRRVLNAAKSLSSTVAYSALGAWLGSESLGADLTLTSSNHLFLNSKMVEDIVTAISIALVPQMATGVRMGMSVSKKQADEYVGLAGRAVQLLLCVVIRLVIDGVVSAADSSPCPPEQELVTGLISTVVGLMYKGIGFELQMKLGLVLVILLSADTTGSSYCSRDKRIENIKQIPRLFARGFKRLSLARYLNINFPSLHLLPPLQFPQYPAGQHTSLKPTDQRKDEATYLVVLVLFTVALNASSLSSSLSLWDNLIAGALSSPFVGLLSQETTTLSIIMTSTQDTDVCIALDFLALFIETSFLQAEPTAAANRPGVFAMKYSGAVVQLILARTTSLSTSPPSPSYSILLHSKNNLARLIIRTLVAHKLQVGVVVGENDRKRIERHINGFYRYAGTLGELALEAGKATAKLFRICSMVDSIGVDVTEFRGIRKQFDETVDHIARLNIRLSYAKINICTRTICITEQATTICKGELMRGRRSIVSPLGFHCLAYILMACRTDPALANVDALPSVTSDIIGDDMTQFIYLWPDGFRQPETETEQQPTAEVGYTGNIHYQVVGTAIRLLCVIADKTRSYCSVDRYLQEIIDGGASAKTSFNKHVVLGRLREERISRYYHCKVLKCLCRTLINYETMWTDGACGGHPEKRNTIGEARRATFRLLRLLDQQMADRLAAKHLGEGEWE